MPLRKDVKSPLGARNDAEKAADRHRQREEAGREEARGRRRRTRRSADAAEAKPPAAPPVDIDLDGFESRAVVLPPKAGNYADLQAIKGKLLYRRAPRTGSGDDKSPIVYYDLEEREEKTVLDDADGRSR